MRKTPIVVSLAVLGLVLAGCGSSPNARPEAAPTADAPEELVFAVVPTDNSKALEASFMPLVAAIEEGTGIPTRIEAVSSNAGVIEAQAAERVDIAVYGAFSYYLATDVADITPVAMDQLTPKPGSGAVQSYGVVAGGSDIASIDDVAGRTVCFTDPASTTGYLAAAAGLLEAGIDPENDITPIFAGKHDVAVTQMLAGDCEVAFVAGTFITDLLPARGVIAEGDTATVWTSPDIPGTPLVIGNWLSDDLKEKIIEAVLGYDAVTAAEAGLCDDAQRESPSTWGDEYTGTMACEWGGTGAFAFEPATDGDYDSIRTICDTTQAEVCRND
ncbi:phosphate/phosphite/phosphonate ABC transporter substrate-binding protein [Microbacterium caowuchunii]|uniref:phosphate/phosphite/phosphonate ABC transporter substrate-binding protein n=1 Tax=Microbacterium caowuchunii TaxID=2614638 RepID=UPI0017804102|nr:phosphate/phosphite/phosphonate ABC transporter substrate-binding protein [Microbacterium caowuchunii]